VENKQHRASAEEPELDVREALHVLQEYKWLIAAVAIVVMAVGVVWTLRTPKVYEATCTLEYDPDPSRPLGGQVEDVADPIGNFWATREFFETQNQVIASRGVAERVVMKLGLHEDPTYLTQDDDALGPTGDVEAAARALQSRLTVEPVKDTRLVRIHARDVKPERARLIADAVADAYVRKTIDDRLESTDRAKDWLENQLATLRSELDAAELALPSFKKEHKVLSVSMEDRQNLVANDIQATHDRLTQTRNRRIELEARLKRLRVSLGKGVNQIDPAVIENDPAFGELVIELRDKKQEQDALAVKYGPQHPTMKSLAQEVDILQRQVAQERAAIIRSAEHDVQQVKAVEEGLRAAAKSAHSAGLSLNLREIEYRRLNRERDNKAALVEIVLQRLTETELTRMLKTTHVRVLDRALLPTSPVSPYIAKNLAGSLLVGLLLGLAVAFFGSRLDRTVRSVEMVEGLGLTVLGVVPHLSGSENEPKPPGDPKKAKISRATVPPARGDMIVFQEPMSPAAETFRMIRTNLAFMSQEAPLRSLVVTSALPLEGKTTVVTNLATSLAQFGRSTLLVDADLRRPRVHRVFKVDKNVGLTSLVVGEATLREAIRPTHVEGLSVLPSGPIPPNPSELLHSSAFGRLKEDLLLHYDYVIFDSPPMGAVTDAAVLAPQVDGVLLVVRAGRTTRDSILSAQKQLSSVSARLVGSVLNDIDVRMRRQRYGRDSYRYRYTAQGYAPIERGADAA
jgi:capsular exopolysaccharide synthesis family protein